MDGGGIAPVPVPAALPRHAGRTLSGAGVTGLTAASAVLLLLCLAGRFLWVYNKESAASARASPPPPVHVIVVARPLHRAVPLSLSLLPVSVHAKEHRGAPDYYECAVCLSEFGDREEAGRLLPVCGHGFHEACIAAWLQLSSTCPLCRAAVASPE